MMIIVRNVLLCIERMYLSIQSIYYSMEYCVLDLHLCFNVFFTWWENPSVFHLHYSFVRSFERDNIEHLCGEILNQSLMPASTITRDSIEAR